MLCLSLAPSNSYLLFLFPQSAVERAVDALSLRDKLVLHFRVDLLFCPAELQQFTVGGREGGRGDCHEMAGHRITQAN